MLIQIHYSYSMYAFQLYTMILDKFEFYMLGAFSLQIVVGQCPDTSL